MIRRVLSLCLVGFVTAALYYISRFWNFNLWTREGLFGLSELPPRGGLLARWLQGTYFAPFELLIWVICAFLVLSALQKVFDWLTPPPKNGDTDD